MLPDGWEVDPYFYPRPPRGGRPTATQTIFGQRYFYPRPPRGGRRSMVRRWSRPTSISIHALREEGDSHAYKDYAAIIAFLSTPSARRATVTDQVSHGGRIFLSTPSARRATQSAQEAADSLQISIHALREEGDHLALRVELGGGDFYPRPPRGGRHLRPLECSWVPPISIHALREEGDGPAASRFFRWRKFLSTPSARRATSFFIWRKKHA